MLLFPAGILLAPLLLLQNGESSAALQKEADFALALTMELGFDNFSESVLSRGLESASSAEDRGLLLLRRCEVRKLVSGRSVDPKEHLQALGAAGLAYIDFLDSEPSAKLMTAGQTSLGEVAFQFGLILNQFRESGKGTEEEIKAFSAEAEVLFEKALRGVNALIQWWSSISDEDVKEAARFRTFYPASFYKALIYYNWALLFERGSIEREENAHQALAQLEDFSVLVGTMSRAGLMAFKHIGDCYTALGEWEDGEVYFQHVMENGIPEDEDLEFPMGPAEKTQRYNAIQDAYLGLEKMYGEAGQSANANQLGKDFQARVAKEAFKLNSSGYRLLLHSADNLILDGQFGDAISLAQRVANENEQSVLRLEANAVMARAIAAAPVDAAIDFNVLYGAAEGAYHKGDFHGALDGFRLLLGRLAKSSKADEFLGKTYYYLGRALTKMDRRLEGAVAHQRGFEMAPTDEDWASRNAKAWRALAETFRTSAPTDEVLSAFYDEALRAETASGETTPNVALMRAAKADYNNAKTAAKLAAGKDSDSQESRKAVTAYQKAIGSFQRIEKGSPTYEEAMVKIALCHFHLANFQIQEASKAAELFTLYLEEWIPNPENNPVDAKGRKIRTDSVVRADFYRGRAYRKMARAGDLSAWQKLLGAFEGFRDRYPDQADFSHASMTYRIEAYIALNQRRNAETEFDLFLATKPKAIWINSASFSLYRYLSGKILDGMDEKVALELKRSSASYLHSANTHDSRPKWQNIVSEARLRNELGEISTAAKLFESVLTRFGDDPALDDSSRFYIQIELVDAYLRQDQAGIAAPYIDQLLKTRPKNLRVKGAAVKVKCGFPVIRDRRVVEIPGEGTAKAYKEAYSIIKDLLLLAEASANKEGVNKWKFEGFWRAKLQQVYLLYKRGQINTSFKGKHATLVRSIERLAPDFGESVCGANHGRIFRWLKTQP